MDKLAIYGGEKVKTTPYGDGNRYGEAELKELSEALNQGTLFYCAAAASKVKTFVKAYAERYGANYCVATSSGTAAVHVALGSLGISAGDEVITTPITDMGSIIGIIAQNAVPIFADVAPNTYNIDPASIERCITEKTKAIVAVHLAGNPCDMDAIMEIAKKYNVKVVEDCCQAQGAMYKGKLVGTIGDIGCFSFNEFKHISAGDGGCVIMNDEELYYRAHRFADKEYDRLGKSLRKIPFLAPNYRMNELTAACVLGQMTKVNDICAHHHDIGEAYTAGIKDIPGVTPHKVYEGGYSTYLWYLFTIDEKVLGVDRATFVKALQEEGISAGEGYIPECVYEYDMFKNREGYIGTHCPFDCAYYGKEIEYKKGLAPVAENVLKTSVRLPIGNFFTDEDVEQTVRAIRKVAAYFLENK